MFGVTYEWRGPSTRLQQQAATYATSILPTTRQQPWPAGRNVGRRLAWCHRISVCSLEVTDRMTSRSRAGRRRDKSKQVRKKSVLGCIARVWGSRDLPNLVRIKKRVIEKNRSLGGFSHYKVQVAFRNCNFLTDTAADQRVIVPF